MQKTGQNKICSKYQTCKLACGHSLAVSPDHRLLIGHQKGVFQTSFWDI